ncbi:hypothetical protein KI387_026420, partial [Taxus chinensis]
SENSVSSGGFLNQLEAYLKQVRDTFKDNSLIYDNFSERMSHFMQHRIHTSNVIDVKIQFLHHRHLRLGFNTFVPKDCEKVAFVYDKAIDYFDKVQRRFRNDEQTHVKFLKILKRYKEGRKSINEVCEKIVKLFEDHSDLVEEFESFLFDPECGETLFNSPKRGKFNGSKGDCDQKTEKSRGGTFTVEIEQTKTPERETINEENRDHNESHGRTFTVEIEQTKMPERETTDEENRDRNESHGKDKEYKQDANELLENVKAKLQDFNQFQEFLKYLDDYSLQIIDQYQLQSLVSNIIGKDEALMDGFNDFISQLEKIGIAAKDNKIQESNEESNKIQDLSNPELSFLLRKDYKSDEACSKKICKNRYEEIISYCEEDRFELDMLLETTAATIQRMENLQDDTVNNDGEFRIEKHLTDVNLLSIERIYGDFAIDMIDQFRKRTAKAFPVILTRLKQKHKEQSRCLEDLNKIWAAVYANN